MARILLVDDDEALRKLLETVLKRAGHEVTVARDGMDAIRLYDLQPPDLVVTDLIMPEKEGVETIQELRKRNPKLKIIAMSGGGRISAKNYLDIAKMVGVDEVFAKPFLPAELIERVNKVLGAP